MRNVYYLGICLLVWLTAGFVTGIRIAHVENEEYRRRMLVMRETAQSDQQLFMVEFFANRRNFVVASTLLGLFAFWLDTASVFKEAKKSLAERRAKRKK